MSEVITRRHLLRQLVGGGALVLGAPLLGPGLTTGAQLLAQDAPAAAPFAPSLWLAIDAQGAVTIVTHRSEMGTGVRTCLPAVVADELGADLARVTIEQALGDEAYGSQNTDGSRSVRRFLQTMREAGAAARLLLERAAAQTWSAPLERCLARDHAVHLAGSERRLGFGELVALARTLPAPKRAELRFRPAAELRYVGKAFPSKDAPAIAVGKARYGLDVRLPGMKFACVARCPVYGGALASHDAAEALAVPGVEGVVVLPPFEPPHRFQALGGVAVVATNTWAALEGRRKLKLEWEPGPNASYDSRAFRQELLEAVRTAGVVVRERGDVPSALEAAAKRTSAEYTTPLLAHAPMEPPCAVARYSPKLCEVWAPTQNPQADQATLASALGLPPEQVRVHVTLLGGGFGRKSKPDFSAEAALVSRAVNAPVQLVWTREDDLRHSFYHAPAALRLEGGVDAAGKLTAWQARTAFSSIGSTFVAGQKVPNAGELRLGFIDLPYALEHLRLERGEASAHVRIGWMRSVCNIFHAFAAGSFTDELAHLAGRDPAEFLLEAIGPARQIELEEGVEYDNYGEPLEVFPLDAGRLRGVVERVKERAWGRKLPAGHALGIAAHRSFHAYVAVVVEAAVDDEGRVRVPRVDLAVDLGQVVNLDRVRAQMEGSVVFGLSLALRGEITAREGRIEQSNFHDYPVLRIYEAPREINVEIVASEAPAGGAGEPGVPPVAPALANAIFKACGQRLRDLPLRPAPRR